MLPRQAVARNLLRFSPVKALGREPTNEDVRKMVIALRSRGVLKKRFLSFRQFTNLCLREGCGGTGPPVRAGRGYILKWCLLARWAVHACIMAVHAWHPSNSWADMSVCVTFVLIF